MRMWLLGGVIWAVAIGAVLYFTPKNGSVLPLPASSTSRASQPVAKSASLQPTAVPVTDVVDLNPLLEPTPQVVRTGLVFEDDEGGLVSDTVSVVGPPGSMKQVGVRNSPTVIVPPQGVPPQIPMAGE